jgi:NDP-sugar pyrophosphorylase family protein
MDDLIKLMIQKEFPVGKYHLKEYWLDIGRLNDYEKAQDLYNKNFFKD